MTYVIGTAGHVDHGKSTLVEALTGINPDRLAEEKEREMTIDLGFAWLTLPDGESVGVVDVPGHRDFIENMLAGVGGIDLALLVVAADEGVMPQTREHLAILDLLEVERGIVALTKIDVVDDPELLDLAELEIADILKPTHLADCPIVPVSARTGQGLGDLITSIATSLAECPPRPDYGRPRMPVDRVFTMSGFGTVVTGTLVGGRLLLGDEVELVPGELRGRIRGLQSHKESIETAYPGSRVAVNISGISKDQVDRGLVVTHPGYLKSTELIDVQFRYLPDAGRPLKHNAEVKFFSGASESLAHVRLVGDRELAPGSEGWLQLRLTDAIALDRGDRFILRFPSPPQTVGGGVVLDAHPPHRWRRYKPDVIARFETLAAGTPGEILLHALNGGIAFTIEQAAESSGLSREMAIEVADSLAASGEIIQPSAGILMSYVAWNRTAGYITRELEAYHSQNPLRRGMPREALRSRLNVPAKLYNLLITMGTQAGLIVDDSAFMRLPDHSVEFTPQQEFAIARLMDMIQKDPVSTPSVKDAAAVTGNDVLQALTERGDLVIVSGDVLFDAATYERLVAQVRDYITTKGAITVKDARDMFGTSRKYVLALLEHLDEIGYTKRVGDERILR